LYERPVNRFVAGFIGSPAMNFIEGRLVREDGLRFVSTDGRIAFPLKAATAAGIAGPADVTAGIRPEHLRRVSDTDPAGMPMTVDVVEPMGNELILYARTDDHEVVARVPPDSPPEPGSIIRLAVDERRVHLFDATTGAALR
jgi:multiple sugar transport system ATP-binding protein